MDLVAEIWLCLLLAALTGGIIGWLLRGARCGRELGDLKARGQNRLGLLRTDLDDARHQLADARAKHAEQVAAHSSLQLEIEQREARAVNLLSTIEAYSNDIEKKNSQALELASALDACQLDSTQKDVQLKRVEQDLDVLRAELEATRDEATKQQADPG
jgi:chromosome segregation ATPase